MTKDELIIKRFCAEYKIELTKLYSYFRKTGYVLNPEGRIEVLNLLNLRIKSIPAYIAELSELKVLDLLANELTSIKNIDNLTKLAVLEIQGNNIKDIAPLKKLKHLKYMNLDGNPITDLEPLLDLNMHFTSNSQYKTYNNEISIIGCNDIKNPPIDIVKQGDEAIRRYFKRIREEGSDNIYEAKLIFVGEGGSGKTSLQRRLLDEKAELPKNEERTRGIEVVDFEFEPGKIAHIWDFGGQVVYYPVHRFFITENSVFVLLASTRNTAHNFDYWLPTIYQFGGESPVIIGQTCHDGHTERWNDVNNYLGNTDFNIIKTLPEPYYPLNLPDNNKGLKTIKECITSQIKSLHHFGKSVPKSWVTVRNALLKRPKSDPYIPFQSFANLCEELEPDHFKESVDIEDCCNFLHDIGVILWYSKIEELKAWVILEPEWAMKAVYKIIDDGEIQKNNGHIRPEDFTRLWSDESDNSYEAHIILKEMLKAFQIAFSTKHPQKLYIIPALQIAIPKEKIWASDDDSLHIEYRFEFMPKGIVNQLSAELSGCIQDNEVWNNAVNLTHENSKSQVIENSYFRELTITSKGVDARGMNILIMNALKNIIKTYKGVKEKIVIKCTCDDCRRSEDPYVFSYDQLVEKYNRKNNAIIRCNHSDKDFNIKELLYSVGLPQPIKNIYIFLASSEELKEDRKEFAELIRRENEQWMKKGIFFKLVIWEDFIDRMSKTRLQDEYNKSAMNSDIFVSLFWTKTGKYTKEEFNEAFIHFKETGKPSIFTYFKNESMNPDSDNSSRLKFMNELKNLGHYPTHYKNIEDLKYQFKTQLQKIFG